MARVTAEFSATDEPSSVGVSVCVRVGGRVVVVVVDGFGDLGVDRPVKIILL